jgi:hypothetical protein
LYFVQLGVYGPYTVTSCRCLCAFSCANGTVSAAGSRDGNEGQGQLSRAAKQ